MAQHPEPQHGMLASTALFQSILQLKRLDGPFLIPYVELVIFVGLGVCFGLMTSPFDTAGAALVSKDVVFFVDFETLGHSEA